MCGIAGIHGIIPGEKRKNALDALTHRLAHRGPDGCGHYEQDDVTLVHTRLSIIDLSERGNQPFYNEDNTLVLVCNGEIYNYLELRDELIAKGHVFRSGSDSEVVLHLYEEYRDNLGAMLNRLTGMFAFALWDTVRKQLFIARDRIGIKPLYYYYEQGVFMFSSEVKPIAATGIFEPKVDYTSLYEYFLLGSIPAPNTFFAQVKNVAAGHYMTISGGKLQVKEYWDITSRLQKWKSEDEVAEATEALLTDVVKDHLVADVPVGTFLSAGVDSSLITAIAVKHHPGIHSFTASFPGEPEDEGVIAADIARRLGTTHHSYNITTNFFDDFDRQFRDIDQVFAISSALSLGRISKKAREEVKVVLSGDGGDELFGGYGRHVFSKFPSFLRYIPAAIQDDVLRVGAKITGKESLQQLRVNLKIPAAQRFLDKITATSKASALSFFTPEIAAQIDTERFLRRIGHYFEKGPADDKLNTVLYVDMKTTLIDEMLTKCDRMTMINGIEGRVPFLDHRFVELAFSIPSVYKRTDAMGKLPLRKILAKLLGSDIAYREKTGFNSPLSQWLQKDKATHAFAVAQVKEARQIAFLDKGKLNSYIEGGALPAFEVFELVCLNSFYSNLNKPAAMQG